MLRRALGKARDPKPGHVRPRPWVYCPKLQAEVVDSFRKLMKHGLAVTPSDSTVSDFPGGRSTPTERDKDGGRRTRTRLNMAVRSREEAGVDARDPQQDTGLQSRHLSRRPRSLSSPGSPTAYSDRGTVMSPSCWTDSQDPPEKGPAVRPSLLTRSRSSRHLKSQSGSL